MNSFRFFNWLAKGDKKWSDISAAEQMAFLHSLKQPANDSQRSFAQYQCQCYFRPKGRFLMQEIASMLLFPLLLILYLSKSLMEKNSRRHVDAIGEFKDMPEIVPDSICEEYDIDNDLWNSGASISFSDLGVVLCMVRSYFFSPYFVTKCMGKLARYSFLIRTYTPRAIIVHAEYSFTSSFLTYYCERHGVKHINVMHGEKLIYIGWSFFRFSNCYVWGNHYYQLFLDMRAEQSQFKIEVPKALRIDAEKNYQSSAYADYKYYLQIYSEIELQQIIKSLGFIEKKGKTLRYRPHPRFSDISLLEKLVPREQIEYPSDVDILTSVASCNTAIGYCSTVLYQAYLCGKEVVLDDVTYKQGYDQLKEHRYVLSSENVLTLSNLQV